MRMVSKRELNQNTAAVLAQVTDTDEVVVTERGTPRWRVSTVRDTESALSRLEREGGYTPPASEPAPWKSVPGGREYTSAEVDSLLDHVRGDR